MLKKSKFYFNNFVIKTHLIFPKDQANRKTGDYEIVETLVIILVKKKKKESQQNGLRGKISLHIYPFEPLIA